MTHGTPSETFIRGRAFALRPTTEADYVDHLEAWTANREVTRYLVRGTFPTTADDRRLAFRSMADSQTDLEFAVDHAEIGTVGLAGLHSIQWVPRSAEFRVLIGDPAAWGKGIGTEVLQLLIGYGIETLNLHKVWLGVNASNERAMRSYERCGMTREGVLRDEVYRNGRYYDVVRYSILADEYKGVVATWPTHSLILDQFRGSD